MRERNNALDAKNEHAPTESDSRIAAIIAVLSLIILVVVCLGN
jgi:hypothetical protein